MVDVVGCAEQRGRERGGGGIDWHRREGVCAALMATTSKSSTAERRMGERGGKAQGLTRLPSPLNSLNALSLRQGRPQHSKRRPTRRRSSPSSDSSRIDLCTSPPLSQHTTTPSVTLRDTSLHIHRTHSHIVVLSSLLASQSSGILRDPSAPSPPSSQPLFSWLPFRRSHLDSCGCFSLSS